MKKTILNSLVLLLALSVAVSCKKKPGDEPSPGAPKSGSQTEKKDTINKVIITPGLTDTTAILNGLIKGINGHALDPSPSPYASISPDEQISLVKRLGMSYYRFGVGVSPTGVPANPWTLRTILASAGANNITILPMVQMRGLNYALTDEENYKAGKSIGSGFASAYGKYFDYYELGNEQENHILVSGSAGDKIEDYDTNKVKSIAAFMRGMDEGIKAADPGAKTMTAVGWLHYGFFKALSIYGYQCDVIDYHWYSDMEGAAKAKFYRIDDITQKLASEFPGMPIWFTEINQKIGTKFESEESQQKFITEFTAKCAANPAVKAVMIYELFDEPDKNSDSGKERDYGIIKWINAYTQWEFKLIGKSLIELNNL